MLTQHIALTFYDYFSCSSEIQLIDKKSVWFDVEFKLKTQNKHSNTCNIIFLCVIKLHHHRTNSKYLFLCEKSYII
jgi:hypothetical protein